LLYCLGGLASLLSRQEAIKGREREIAHGVSSTLCRSGHIVRPCRAPAEVDHLGVIVVTWFWLNIPLALLFFCCWTGIPLWLMLTRWRTELNAKHAELAPETGPAPVFTQPDRAVAHQTSGPAHADLADAHPFPVRLRRSLSQAARRQRR
jgi:hypothetical protein